jgi:hypothetical protein
MPRILTNSLLIAITIMAFPAQAALQARDLNSDSVADAYYDTVLNITWLKNANLAKSNTFGLPSTTSSPGVDILGAGGLAVVTSGAMQYPLISSWLGGMNDQQYLGYGDWRLPSIKPINPNGIFDFTMSNSGATDGGTNISAPGTPYAGSTSSEMAYMYYNNLVSYGGGGGSSLFDNLGNGYYWSNQERFIAPFGQMGFSFSSGVQISVGRDVPSFVWAVRNGDSGTVVSPVPEPETWGMMMAGLGLLGVMARRKKRI